MPEIKAFNGWRYVKENVADMICPPYDIIDEDEKKKLQKRSPFNIVNIELPDARNNRNKYQNAAALFKEWQKEEIIACDQKPALYIYEQVFEHDGMKMTRRGFFCALDLENPLASRSSVKPHEKTLSKPKADRLSLLKAVKANISPIFGLFDDDKNFTSKIVNKIIANQPPTAKAFDEHKIFHRIWKLDDDEIVEKIVKFIANKKMIIADGHHRYETAWTYSQERKEKDDSYNANKDYCFVMAFLCPIEDPGILILPTHRLIDDSPELEENIAKYFDVYPEKDYSRLSRKEIQPLIVVKNKKKRVLVVKNDAIIKKAMPKKGKAYRNLGVSILHYILLPNVDASDFVYIKDEKEVIRRANKENKVAIIVPATPVKSLKEISFANEMMPQKSTYFYPKLASGLVMRGV